MTLRRFLTLVLLLGNVSCANLNSGDAIAADDDIWRLEQLANEGNAQAAFKLGMYYTVSNRNAAHATNWLKIAADLGSVDAQLNLGLMFFQDGMAEDALRYTAMAAGSGDKLGMARLAEILDSDSFATLRDLRSSRLLLTRAAELGDVKSLVLVAEMEAQGVGGAKDPEAALLHLEQALEIVHPSSILADEISTKLTTLRQKVQLARDE